MSRLCSHEVQKSRITDQELGAKRIRGLCSQKSYVSDEEGMAGEG